MAMKNFIDFAAERGNRLIGTWVKIPSLATIELLGLAGFDFLVIDMEHAPHSLPQAYDFIFAAQMCGMAAVVRLPDHTGSDIQRLLDSGADGLLVPRVPDVPLAERITRQMIFSPKGERGLGGTSRAGGWAVDFSMADYVRRGNEQCLRMVQLEDWDTLNAVEDYLALENVNGVFVGLGDLWLSSGKTQADPEVQAMIAHVGRAAQAAGKHLGVAAGSPEAARRFLDQGYTLVMVSNDTTMFGRAAADIVKATRGG